MCTVVIHHATGYEVSTPLEMFKFGWPVTPADFAFDFADLQPDDCLCNVDVTAILDRHGVSWSEEVPGFVDVPAGKYWGE